MAMEKITEEKEKEFKSIIVPIELWKKLMQIKIDKDFSSIPKAIESLLTNGK